ncbi:MAG: DUF4129 domain-containing protein [Thermogutta sp.]
MLPERRTAVDFVALIVSPVLVMMMVGSLVFLLQESFYRGDFPMRLRWVSGLFVFAAVLIAWITIEMGRTRAGLYLSPLFILGVIALDRFVESQIWGIPVLTTIFHLIIVVSVWLVCHHLMLDCLLVDEDSLPPLGKGLLEEWSQPASAPRSAAKTSVSWDEAERVSAGERENRALSIWLDRIYPDRPQGPPGRSVLYVLLGGLVVIAVASLNGPAPGAVTYAAGYVMAGLGLLMTTNLLQLRLYLRGRNLAMPGDAVRGWMIVGGAVIIGGLLLAWLLPKPAMPTWSWGVYLKSPLRKASEFASRGMEPASAPSSKGSTAGDSRSASGKTSSAESSDDRQAARPKSGEESTNGDEAGGKSDAESSGKPQNDQGRDPLGTESRDPRSANKESSWGKDASQSTDPQSPSSKSPTSGDDRSRGDEREKSSRSLDGSDRSERGTSDRGQGQKDQPGSRGEERTWAGGTQSEADHPRTDRPQESQTDSGEEDRWKAFRRSLPQVSLNQVASGLTLLLRMLITLAFLAAVAWLAWRYRHEIMEVLRQWWEQFRRQLESLFGRKRVSGEEKLSPVPATPKVPPFASFKDPFASGLAASQSPVWLVVYSFEALQACGDGLGMPREPDETPKEYARRLRSRDLNDPAAFDRLCELYNLVAYAGRSGTLSLSAEDRHALASAWRQMLRAANEGTAAGGPVPTH